SDPEAEPGIGEVVELVVLRLQADRGEPELVGGGIGNASVQATPDSTLLLARWRRRDGVGPLDRVAPLVERTPGRERPRLAHRADAALVQLLVGARAEVQRIDRVAGVRRYLRGTPRRERGAVINRQRLRRGVS